MKTFFDIDTDAFAPAGTPRSEILFSQLSLFDPDGTLVAFDGDSSGDPDSDPGSVRGAPDAFIGVYTLPTNGFYRIAVSGESNSPTSLSSASSSVSLTRPDGGNGGIVLTGATVRDSSFNLNPSSQIGNYTLHISRSSEVVPAPEPGTMTLMGIGLASLGAARRKKKGQSKDNTIA